MPKTMGGGGGVFVGSHTLFGFAGDKAFLVGHAELQKIFLVDAPSSWRTSRVFLAVRSRTASFVSVRDFSTAL